MKRFLTLLFSTLLLFGCESDNDTSYTVSFDVLGESYLSPITVSFGSTVYRPISPSIEGYVFDDWYSDSEFSELWDFDTPVTEDMTLYAKFYDTSDGDDMVLIYNKNDLIAFRNRVNSGELTICGLVMDNIDLSGENWIPIGLNKSFPYEGLFSGNFHTITGLTINSSDDYQGLFGYVNKATIKNISLESPQITGKSNVGAICGSIFSGIISNCNVNNGSVTASGNYVGGVVGFFNLFTSSYESSFIIYCYNTASVSGNSYVGGVAGWSNSTASSCFNTGSISGYYYVGGVIGEPISSLPITACYNTGTISGTSYIGGVAGCNDKSAITACYNTGSVSGSSYTGGIVGMNYSSSYFTSCYNSGAVSGKSYTGGIIGTSISTSCVITNCYYLPYEGIVYSNTEGSPSEELVTTMKSSNAVTTLNSATNETLFKYDSEAINDSYPILVSIDYK